MLMCEHEYVGVCISVGVYEWGSQSGGNTELHAVATLWARISDNSPSGPPDPGASPPALNLPDISCPSMKGDHQGRISAFPRCASPLRKCKSSFSHAFLFLGPFLRKMLCVCTYIIFKT